MSVWNIPIPKLIKYSFIWIPKVYPYCIIGESQFIWRVLWSLFSFLVHEGNFKYPRTQLGSINLRGGNSLNSLNLLFPLLSISFCPNSDLLFINFTNLKKLYCWLVPVRFKIKKCLILFLQLILYTDSYIYTCVSNVKANFTDL